MRTVRIAHRAAPLISIIAAWWLFLGPGVRPVLASEFAPTFDASLSSHAAGDPASIVQTADFGTSPIAGQRSLPASAVYFTPADWGVPDCSPTAVCPYAVNERTGDFVGTLSVGILSSQCAVALPVTFPDGMRNASTDPADSIAAGPGFANLISDVAPANGIPDGVEHWNDLLDDLIGAGLLPSAPPRERQILSAGLLGLQLWVDVLTYDPGLVGGAATAPQGYATVFVLQNLNPTKPASPAVITDVCGLFSTSIQAALSSAGAVHRSNPTSPGTRLFVLEAASERDADQGPSAPTEPTQFVFPGGLSGAGLVNSIDTCPFQPNLGSVLAPADAPFDGDLEAPGDGIDSVCDPAPELFSGVDFDADAYLNRGDNCPQVANGAGFGAGDNNQADLSELTGAPASHEVGPQPADGGPASDSIGDDCDLNPAVPDGHFHRASKIEAVCVGLADGDGDGWCDLDEDELGSEAAGTASTPEALAAGTCSDGADNDGDAATDLGDAGCQLPAHDLSIKKLIGPTLTCNGSKTKVYNLLLQNGHAEDEDAEISIYLDSQPPYVPAPGPAPAPGKSAGSVAKVSGATVTQSGQINIDGDADIEWLTKATVDVRRGPAGTAVRFDVTYPECGAGPNVTSVDYTLAVDVCHAGDVAPLGVNPLFGSCAGGAADGGQDANDDNDVLTRSIDDVSR